MFDLRSIPVTPQFAVFDSKGHAYAVNELDYHKAANGLLPGFSANPPRFIDMPWGTRVAV